MVTVPSFPLLNLPLLPLKEIISYMEQYDQMWFPMLSKKTNNLLKTKRIFNLEIYSGRFGTTNKIVCKNQDESIFLTIEINELYQNHERKYGLTRTIGGLAVPMTLENNILRTFWNDKMDGLQKMLSLLCKTFRIGSVSIYLFNHSAKTCIEVIEKFRKIKLESNIRIGKISMSSVEVCINYLLEKCNDIPEITVSNSFKTMRIPIQNLTLSGTDYCEIKNAGWVTLNDLNQLTKYKKIKLWKMKLTIQELRSFLKKWMESSTMENIELTMEYVELDRATQGFLKTTRVKNLMFHGMELGPMYCFEIIRKDGVKANFWTYDGYVMMKTYK